MLSNIVNLTANSHLRLIIRGGGFAMISKIITLVLSVITSLLISRWYGAETLGIIAIINAVVMLLTTLSVMGLDTAILKLVPEYSSDHYSAARVIYRNVLLYSGISSIVISLFLFLTSDWLAVVIFSKPELGKFMGLLAFVFIFKTYERINSEFVRGFERVLIYALVQIMPSVFILFGIIILSGFIDYDSLPIYIYICSSVIVAIVSMTLSFSMSFKKNEQVQITHKEIFNVSLPMMLSASMFFLSSQTDMLMLGAMCSVSEVAVYSVDVRLASLTIFVIVSLNSMMAPRFSHLFHTRQMKELEYVVKKSSKLIFISTVPVVLSLMLLGKLLLGFWGDEFTIGYVAMILLVIGQFFNAVCGPTGNFLNMTGNHRLYMKIVLVSSIINITLNYLLIPYYGIEGASFSTMVSIVTLNMIATYVIRKKVGYFIFYNPLEKSTRKWR